MVGAFNTDPPMYRRYNTEIDPTFLNVDNVPENSYELDDANHIGRWL
jgi:hypothetical protein